MAANLESVRFVALGAAAWMTQGIELTLPYTRNGEAHGTPYDPRLGALENGVKCHTCGGDNTRCPGHFGWIRLYTPMFNPVYIDVVHNIYDAFALFVQSPSFQKKKLKCSDC